MFNSPIKKVLAAILLALVIVGAAFYAKKAQAPINTEVSSQNNNQQLINNDSATAEIIIDGQKVTVPALRAEEIAKIPKPSLDRSISFGPGLDNATKEAITKAVSETEAELKKNPLSLDKWTMLGTQLKIAGDYQGAAEVWGYVVKVNPKNIAAFSNLGDLYENYLKDYALSESNFKKVIANDKEYATGYLNLANLYHYKYKTGAGLDISTLKTGLINNPSSIDIAATIGNYYKEAGDKAGATIYYNKALDIANKAKNTTAAASIKAVIDSLK